MRKALLFLAAFGLFSPVFAAAGEVNDRVVRAAVVLREITDAPDKGVPQDLLDKCACVAVVPGMIKGGFIVGANYGKGLMSCRTGNGEGPWSAPAMFLVEGGSVGFQLGAQATDLVLVIMNTAGMDSVLDSKFTLGGDAAAAAGPVGRTAAIETDVLLGAKIFAYSRSRGLFGGLSIKGGVIRPDNDANHVLYNKAVEPRSLLTSPPQPESMPRDAKIFFDELNRISPKRKSAATER